MMTPGTKHVDNSCIGSGRSGIMGLLGGKQKIAARAPATGPPAGPDQMGNDEGDVRMLTETVMQLKLELAEARTTIDLISDENSHLRSEMTEESNELKAATEEGNKLKENLKKLKARMLEMRKKARESERERAEIRVRLEAAQIQRDEYKNKSKDLLSRTEHLMEERDMLSTMVDEGNKDAANKVPHRKRSMMASFSVGSMSMFSQSGGANQSTGELSIDFDSGVASRSRRSSWQNTSRQSRGGGTVSDLSENSLAADGHGSFDVKDLCNSRRVHVSRAAGADMHVNNNLDSKQKEPKRRASTGGDDFLSSILQGVFSEGEDESCEKDKANKPDVNLRRRHSSDSDALANIMEGLLKAEGTSRIPLTSTEGSIKQLSWTPAEA